MARPTSHAVAAIPSANVRLAGTDSAAVETVQPLSLPVEDRGTSEHMFLQNKLHGRREHAQTVPNAPREIDRRRFSKILRRTRDLADAEAEVHALRQHLVVEYEIVRVLEQRQRLEDAAAERSVAGVILRQLRAEKEVLPQGQHAIGHI